MAGAASGKMKGQLAKLAAGAVVGAVAAGLFLAAMEKAELDLDDPATMLAIIAGLCYALMGLAVTFGIVAPRAGARFLNVEDAEELIEQKNSLVPSALVCVLVGLFLLILGCGPALADRFGREPLVIAAAGCLAAAILIGIATRGRNDELMRRVAAEASAGAFHIALTVLAFWAALAHFGYAGWVSPVALIAALALLELVAIFVVSAKHGLMSPR